MAKALIDECMWLRLRVVNNSICIIIIMTTHSPPLFRLLPIQLPLWSICLNAA